MLKKNLLYNALLAVSQFIFPLITFPYSSRILGPQGIGNINFIDSFTQYFILFAALGIPLYGIREISKQRDDKGARDKVFSEIVIIHVISAIFFCLVYLVIAVSIPKVAVHIDLVSVGILTIIAGVFSFEWLFQGMEQFKFITIRTLIVRVFSIVLLFLFLKPNSAPVTYYLIMASGSVINSLTNMYYIRKLVKLERVNMQIFKHLRPLLLIFGSTLAVSVYILMDNVILGFIKDEKAVGIYEVALRIVRLPLAITGAINGIIIPQVSRAFSTNNFEQIRSLIDKSYTLICLAAIPISMGLYVTSDFLVRVFAGPLFAKSSFVLQLMSPLVFLNAMGYIFCVQLLAPLGKEKLLFKTYLVAMLFSIPVNILLVSYYSYNGAAVGMMLTELLATSLSYYFLRQTIKISFNREILFRCAFGAALFLLIAYAVRKLSFGFFIQEMIVIVSCIAFYATYVWFFINNTYLNGLKQKITSLNVFRNG